MPATSVAIPPSDRSAAFSQWPRACGLASPAGRSLILLSLAFLLPVTFAGPGIASDGDEFLKKSVATHSASDTISYSAVASSTVTVPVPEADEPPTKSEIRFRRHHDLLDIENCGYLKDTSKDDVIFTRHTFGSEYAVGYQLRGSKSKVQGLKPSSGVVWKEDLDAERARFLGYVSHCWLDGYLATGGERVSNLLLSVDDRKATPVTMDGQELIEVSGKTEYGGVVAWLNPRHGYLAERIVVQKGPGDLISPGVRLADNSVHAPFPTEYRAFTAEAVVTGVQQAGSTWIANAGTVTFSETFANGVKHQRVVELMRKDIDLHPAFPEDAFQTDLPAAASVNFIDENGTGANFMWDGSKPVLSFRPFDKKRLAPLD